MTDVAQACADLAAWIPALGSALIRDTIPCDHRTTLNAGLVVNLDVLHAILTLQAEVPAIRAQACQRASEPCPQRPIATCLRALPRLRDRLTNIGLVYAARDIDDAVASWTRTVKIALGLRTRDTPVGYDCPLCDESAPLILLGSEGYLRDDRTILWHASSLICCPACGASWNETQWAHLGRLLQCA